MAGLVPALAGHVELELEGHLGVLGLAVPGGAPAVSKSQQVRPAPSSAWISPVKMPCISDAGGVGGVGTVGREPRRRCGGARRPCRRYLPGVLHPLGQRDPDEATVAGEVLDREALPHADTPCARSALWFVPGVSYGSPSVRGRRCRRRRRAASRAWPGGRPPGRRPRASLDQRLQQHLAVAPVVVLVLEDELQRPDGRCVGDRRRVVEVVRVRGDLVRDQHPVGADQLLDGQLGRLGLGHGVDEGDHLVVGRQREPVGVHLPQLGQPLVPQLGMPRVVVAVGAEPHLDVELGHGGHPAAQHLEEPHLDPLVVADPARRLLDGENAGQLTPVPRRERRSRPLRIGHATP